MKVTRSAVSVSEENKGVMIRVKLKTRKRLGQIGSHDETFDMIINKLLNHFETSRITHT